jgi:hypothetical protein
MTLRTRRLAIALMALSFFAVGCRKAESDTEVASNAPRNGIEKVFSVFSAPRATIPAGEQIRVRLAQSLNSETAHSGDSWSGTVTGPVNVEGREVIPAGAEVHGVLVAAEEARQGSRARLQLAVRSVEIGDRRQSLNASAQPVVAGSARTRNLGAIAGGAVAGAILGRSTGKGNTGKGALIGGAVATGAVAASKGYQVTLPAGTVMSFSVTEEASVPLAAAR